MTHIRYKTLILSVLLLSAATVFAGPEAEFKLLSKSWTLHGDGSQEFRYAKELAIYTHTAMNSTYGETFIQYNPEYQEVKIHSSYTKQKDGTIVKTPENAFVEVLPRAAADAPAYNQLRELVVVHTGLELGATIFLDYSVLSKPGYLPEIDLCETLAESSPVKEYRLSISAPEGKPLHYAITNLNAKAIQTVKDGTKQISWTLSNLPAGSKAPYVSVQAGDIPQLTASSFASEKEALEKLQFQYGRTRDLRVPALAQHLTREAKTDTEKLQILLSYVVDEVGYSPLTLTETGFRVRPEISVINTAYGTGAEKLGLLAGLLKGAGIEAKTAAVYPTQAPSASLGLSAISEFIVLASADGREYVLSPTSKSIANAAWYTAYETILGLSSAGEKITLPSPSHAIDCKTQLKVSPDKAEATVTAVLGNGLIPYIGSLQALTQGGKELKTTPGKDDETFEYTAVQTLKSNNGYALLSFPVPAVAFLHSSYDRLNTRRTEHLLLPYPANEQYHYTVTLDEGWQLSTPETNIELDNAVGQLAIQVKQSGSVVHVIRNLALKKQLITPADYAAFRQLLTAWSDPNGTQLLLNLKD
ncbi:DUF3857 domain-containing protein [Parabacteroides sp. Marseille-P3160]|uniref:DUF3857 domain-containing protein n=1 Tax=Parabacteroides sp. Marseille-P3160 TaxID=1917887 RepID=UPI0009B979C2|nr:DUF3857 domain-containing protein [Parabacteroides sp. Marseille-P3160]